MEVYKTQRFVSEGILNEFTTTQGRIYDALCEG